MNIPPLTLLVLFIPFSGCLQTDACSVTMPHARGGDHYLYEATGSWKSWSLAPILAWPFDARPSDARTTEENWLRFPSGGSLEVAIADRPTTALNASGKLESAWQATYWATRHDREGKLPFGDEWIAVSDGAKIQDILRHQRESTPPESLQRLSFVDEPALLLGPALWDRTLTPGSHGTTALRDSLAVIAHPGAGQAGWLRWQVEGVNTVDATCEATIAVTWDPPGPEPQFEVRLTAADGVPLPLVWEQIKPFRGQLRLVSVQPGDGPALPVISSHRTFPASPMQPSKDGFPREDAQPFVTGMADAVQRAEAEPVASEWLAAHPQARLAKATHVQGAPDQPFTVQGRTVDGWKLHWCDSTKAGLRAKVERIEPTLPVGDEFRVTAAPDDACEDEPELLAAVPPLSAIVAHHHAFYQGSPEVLKCELEHARCGIGSHAGTMTPYVDGGSGGSSFGILVSLSSGLIYTQQSRDQSALPPPVPSRA